jgi:hypothetical protein
MTVFGSSYVAYHQLATTRNNPPDPDRRIASPGGRKSVGSISVPVKSIGAFHPGKARPANDGVRGECCPTRRPGSDNRQAEPIREIAAVRVTGLSTNP